MVQILKVVKEEIKFVIELTKDELIAIAQVLGSTSHDQKINFGCNKHQAELGTDLYFTFAKTLTKEISTLQRKR